MSDWEPLYLKRTSWALGLSCSLWPPVNYGVGIVILRVADSWLEEGGGRGVSAAAQGPQRKQQLSPRVYFPQNRGLSLLVAGIFGKHGSFF